MGSGDRLAISRTEPLHSPTLAGVTIGSDCEGHTQIDIPFKVLSDYGQFTIFGLCYSIIYREF